MRIAVAATAPFGADVLERLAATHEIAQLLTRPDARRGRGRRLAPSPAKEVAARHGIPVIHERDAIDADVVVVAAYGLLIPESLLERALWLNVHPSLLPRWRGAAPVERALIAGDSRTGVTIHRTTAELDAGPIAAQEAFDLDPEDDAGTVYARSAEVAARLLDDVLAGEPTFVDQPADGATYAEKITRADRELDPTRPAAELVNRVRALSPHIGARFGDLLVWKAHVTDDGSFEPVEVQPPGGRRMTYAEYLRGSPVITPARAAAYEVLLRVFEQDAYADRVFRTAARDLDDRERAFAQRLAYGAVQRMRTLDHAIETLGKRPVRKLDPPVRARSASARISSGTRRRRRTPP